jgi:hypothetical protein
MKHYHSHVLSCSCLQTIVGFLGLSSNVAAALSSEQPATDLAGVLTEILQAIAVCKDHRTFHDDARAALDQGPRCQQMQYDAQLAQHASGSQRADSGLRRPVHIPFEGIGSQASAAGGALGAHLEAPDFIVQFPGPTLVLPRCATAVEADLDRTDEIMCQNAQVRSLAQCGTPGKSQRCAQTMLATPPSQRPHRCQFPTPTSHAVPRPEKPLQLTHASSAEANPTLGSPSAAHAAAPVGVAAAEMQTMQPQEAALEASVEICAEHAHSPASDLVEGSQHAKCASARMTKRPWAGVFAAIQLAVCLSSMWLSCGYAVLSDVCCACGGQTWLMQSVSESTLQCCCGRVGLSCAVT